MKSYYRMTKEKFLQINEEQKASGLNIADWCEQNGYSKKSFYTWRHMYGLCERNTDNDPKMPSERMEFIPVHINQEKNAVPVEYENTPVVQDDSISIELPHGVKIHFNGKAKSDALTLIAQMISSNVLP